MEDVVFGGTLTYGIIQDGLTAFGNLAGAPGGGGRGGGGGSGADGGEAGYWYYEEGRDGAGRFDWGLNGNGGNGGDGGNGGSAGAYGKGGDAAGAILNDGAIQGTVAFFNNSASTYDMITAGFPTVAGRSGGAGGVGGIGGPELADPYYPSDQLLAGADGVDGTVGLDGAASVPLPQGDSGDDILNRDGSSGSITSANILVYAHGVDVEAGERAGDSTVSFNIIRVGSSYGDVTVGWKVVGDGKHAATGADFAGPGLPHGTVTLKAAADGAFLHAGFYETVSFSVASDRLGEYQEGFRIVLTSVSATDDHTAELGTSVIAGTIAANDLSGTGGADVVKLPKDGSTYHGRSGNDRISGQGGDDRIFGDNGNDTLSGNGGDDTLDGGKGNDGLNGGQGGDTLRGGAGKDTLNGGAGADELYGDAGADKFVFRSLGDSTVNAAGRDTIHDFSHRQGDDIVLSGIDADTTKGGNQAFHFIGTDSFSGQAGELRYVRQASDTFVFGDVDGDGKADFAIHLADAIRLVASDFVL